MGKPFNLFKPQQPSLKDGESMSFHRVAGKMKWGSMPGNVQHITGGKSGSSAMVSKQDGLGFPKSLRFLLFLFYMSEFSIYYFSFSLGMCFPSSCSVSGF